MRLFGGKTVGFTPRSEDRDARNDAERLERLIGLIRTLIVEIDRETLGLHSRYAESRDLASAYLFAAEGEGYDAETSSRLSTEESAIVYCEKRLKALQDQRQVLDQIISKSLASWPTNAGKIR